MQSQQKRVKWSRGETTEALEERTDTGITQASVELMENCIPDVFGNISRRPTLKPIPISDTFVSTVLGGGTGFDIGTTYIIPFYYTETDYFLIGFGTNIELLRIKDGKIVKKQSINKNLTDVTSYAQQNNYMVIATKTANYELRITDTNGIDFTATLDVWKFSAGWYAPYGTKTRIVNTTNVPSLNFTGAFDNYSYTDGINGVMYSIITTSVSYTDKETLESFIPVGSIIQLPNKGVYFRIEGYDFGLNTPAIFPYDITFDGVLNLTDSIPATGTYCKIDASGFYDYVLKVYTNGVINTNYPTIYALNYAENTRIIVKNSNSISGLSVTTAIYNYLSTRTFSEWAVENNSILYAYGSLLTSVADENASDSVVTVEYGYESLKPNNWDSPSPHPKKLVFNQQRLWAGAWSYSTTEEYSLVIGSQTARYNDFQNDYNQENEPITVDILTQFKEKIVHLIDYNGLKIMTNSFEYAYDSANGVVKQSANGSYEHCEPIVFDSLCLYVDSTGYQIKAMQYEFQSNMFNSSSINLLAPHDLIWFPDYMATYEDKINNTGKYLFVLNKYTKSILNPQGEPCPRMAVCNFVPQNQANIWSRWSFPETSFLGVNDYTVLRHIVNMKSETIFFIIADTTLQPTGQNEGLGYRQIIPAILDFDGICDYEANVTNNQIVLNQYTTNTGTVIKTVLGNANVDIFAQGAYQLNTTTNALGYITNDISELTNIKAGYKVNSTIRSHPIDVGGKTKSIKKRIGKAQMSVHDTEPDAISINGKTGYMNPQEDHICFYGVTGMKDEIKYTITNKNGAMFHLESLLMNIEYGTLDS